MNLLRTFFSLLSQEFNIPIQEIEKEWSLIEEGYTSYYPYDKVIINLCDDFHDLKPDPIPTPIPVGNIEKKCLHEFVRSAKKGTLCGERTSSGDFCNKHKKQHIDNESIENTNNDEKKYKNKKKDKNKDKKYEDIQNIENNENKDIKENENKKEKESDPKPDVKKPIAIRLNYKINRYIHSDSGMTFFSKEEKVVFARYDKHQFRLIKLTAEDIVLCKMYGFRVDPNKWNINQGSNEIEE